MQSVGGARVSAENSGVITVVRSRAHARVIASLVVDFDMVAGEIITYLSGGSLILPCYPKRCSGTTLLFLDLLPVRGWNERF